MSTYTTKLFGELVFDEKNRIGNQKSFSLSYNDVPINISLDDFDGNEEKTEKCLEIIDRYSEIHEIALNAIVENYASSEVIRYYFKFHFETLDKEILVQLFGSSDYSTFSIEKISRQFEYPNLVFIQEFDEICFSVKYRLSNDFSQEVLCVKMDENLNVLDFDREA